MSVLRATRLTAFLSAVLVLLGCPLASDKAQPTQVQIGAGTGTLSAPFELYEGQSGSASCGFKATGNDSPTPMQGCVYESVDPSVASVETQSNGTGYIIGEKPGKTTLKATFPNNAGTVTSPITIIPLIKEISPATATKAVGGLQTYTFQLIRVGGTQSVPEFDKIAWKIEPASIAKISSKSLSQMTAEALSAGVATITATYTSRWAAAEVTATLIVTPGALTVTTGGSTTFNVVAGTSAQIPITVKDAAGNTVSNATLGISSAGEYTLVGSTATTVTVRGLTPGTYQVTITATANGVSGSTTVTLVVTAPPPSTGALLSSIFGTPLNGTKQLVAFSTTLKRVFALPALASSIATASTAPWASLTTGFTSSNPAVATVSASGLVTGVSAGTTTITGQWTDGTTDFNATVTEHVGALVTTATGSGFGPVTGASNDVKVGESTAYKCTGTAGGANVVAATTLSSSNTAVATVNNAGVVTGVGVGTATITCLIGGRTITLPVTVNP